MTPPLLFQHNTTSKQDDISGTKWAIETQPVTDAHFDSEIVMESDRSKKQTFFIVNPYCAKYVQSLSQR